MMNQIARELRRPVRVSASLDARVMRAVRQLPRHSRFRLWSHLTTPRSVMVTPLSWGLLAASVALFGLLNARRLYQDVNASAKATASALFPKTDKGQPPQRVQFVLVAPDAKKVAVVGD